MVSLEVRAFFVIYLICVQHSMLQTEGKPPLPSPKLGPNTLEVGASRNSRVQSAGYLIPVLNIALLSASVGKYFLNRKKNISTECHETAMTVVQLWQRLTIVEQVDALIQAAFQDVVGDENRLQETMKNPVAKVCEKLERRFVNDAALSSEFWNRREWLRTHGTNKAYTNVTDMPKTNAGVKDMIAEEFEDPIIGKLLAHVAFVNQLKREKATSREFHVWARAVVALAKEDRLRDAVQTQYDRTRSETADSIVSSQPKHTHSNAITQVFETEMMNNLKENFERDPTLKTDFVTTVERSRVAN